MSILIFIIFIWTLPSFIIGFVGTSRKIGFWGAFFVSLIFSPLIGLIVTLVSKSKEDIQSQQDLLKVQTEQNETLKKMANQQSAMNIADEIKKIKDLLDSNAISQEEYERLKKMVFENQIIIETNEKAENSKQNIPYVKVYEDKCPKCGTINKDDLSFCMKCFAPRQKIADNKINNG